MSVAGSEVQALGIEGNMLGSVSRLALAVSRSLLSRATMLQVSVKILRL